MKKFIALMSILLVLSTQMMAVCAYDGSRLYENAGNIIASERLSNIYELSREMGKAKVDLVEKNKLTMNELNKSTDDALFIYEDTGRVVGLEVPASIANEMGVENNAKTNEVIGSKTVTIKKGSSAAEYSEDVRI